MCYTIAIYLVDSDIELTNHIETLQEWVEGPALLLTLIFLFDLIAHLIVNGTKNLGILYLEILLQIFYWLTYILDFAIYREMSTLQRFTRVNAIFQLRNLRMVELLSEFKEFNVVLQTLKNLTQPIFSKLFFLYILFYLFSILGMY